MGGGVPYLNTAQEFHAAQSNAGGKLLAVDFTASWCGPCKMIGPQFEAMQPQFPYVDFAKVDVDENQEVAMSCGIQAMPTFKFYRFGQQVAEFTGADANKLRALLLSHGGPPTTVDAGCDVAIFGLKARPECNGRRGVVRSFDASKGRYAVELKQTEAEGGSEAETLALKRDNLVVARRVELTTPTDGSVAELPPLCAGSTEGHVVSYEPETNTYLVHPMLESGERSTEAVAVPIACCVLPAGSVGVIVGLGAKPEHNGKEVHVVGVHDESGRYEVAIDSSHSLRLKRANVRM